MKARCMALGLVVGVLAACGGEGPDVSKAARDALGPRVAEVRSLAEAGQPEEARAKLAELRSAAEDLEERGELSESGASAVLEAAALVETQLDLITTTTQPPPPPAGDDEEDEDEDDEGDEGREGRGQGRDKDD